MDRWLDYGESRRDNLVAWSTSGGGIGMREDEAFGMGK